METIDKLLESIKYHNNLYRRGCPEISDTEYDKLVDELRALDPSNSWFSQIEPVQVSNGRKVKLPVPMKSLDKVKNLDDLQNWVKSLGIPHW